MIAQVRGSVDWTGRTRRGNCHCHEVETAHDWMSLGFHRGPLASPSRDVASMSDAPDSAALCPTRRCCCRGGLKCP
nr:hypothetical protein Itr_chr10CG19880 [Ipomoea trifida]